MRNGDPDASPEANPASRQEAFQVPVSIQSADFDTPGSLKIDGKGLGQIACVLLIPENGDNLVSETLSEGDTERIAMFGTQALLPGKYTGAYSVGEDRPTESSVIVEVSSPA